MQHRVWCRGTGSRCWSDGGTSAQPARRSHWSRGRGWSQLRRGHCHQHLTGAEPAVPILDRSHHIVDLVDDPRAIWTTWSPRPVRRTWSATCPAHRPAPAHTTSPACVLFAPDRCPINPLCRVIANTIIAGQWTPIVISPVPALLILADSGQSNTLFNADVSTAAYRSRRGSIISLAHVAKSLICSVSTKIVLHYEKRYEILRHELPRDN